MSNLVVVAIPRDDDPVWQVSSEKVPHMTLLFLGANADHPNKLKMAEFIEHAMKTSLTRFGMSVDRRGVLGADKADVVFFDDSWELPMVKQFRAMLLKDKNIKTAYDSSPQFPEWNPHLTLGYPDKPAKPLPTGTDRLWHVSFDRIALWDGDYAGVEFEIPKYNYGESEVHALYQTADRGADFLAHYGVKGMKWGQRRERRQLNRADKKWEKDVKGTSGWVKRNNAAAEKFNSQIEAFNNDPRWKGKNLNDDPDLMDRYNAEAEIKMTKAYREATKEVHGSNPSGTKRAQLNATGDRVEIVDIPKKETKHADDTVVFILERNAKGFVVNSTPDTIAQGEAFIDDFLAHYGVKGMRWGFRKNRDGSTRTKPSRAEKKNAKTAKVMSELQAKEAAQRSSRPANEVQAVGTIGSGRGSKAAIKTAGGEDHAPAPDAIKVAKARQKLQKSGVNALSNQELKETAERLRLEKEIERLAPRKKSIARRFIDKALEDPNQTYKTANSFLTEYQRVKGAG